MIIRLIADIQKRLFWRAGTGGASECCIPPTDGTRQPKMGNDCHGAGSADGFTDRRQYGCYLGQRQPRNESAHAFGVIKRAEPIWRPGGGV